MTDIVWTAKEALACAYCWTEFYDPEKSGFDSPEAYWVSITERARCDCRNAAHRLLLLAVARGECVAIMPPIAITDKDEAHLGEKMRLKASHRIRECYAAVWHVFAIKARS